MYSEAILERVRQTPQGQKLLPIELGDVYLKEAGRVAWERVFVAGKRLGSLLRGRVRVPSASLTEKSGGLGPYAAALRHSLALVAYSAACRPAGDADAVCSTPGALALRIPVRFTAYEVSRRYRAKHATCSRTARSANAQANSASTR